MSPSSERRSFSFTKSSRWITACGFSLIMFSVGHLIASAGDLNHPRAGQTATVLPNGSVLIIGGENANGSVGDAEIYDPNTGVFTITGFSAFARAYHTATLLADGSVLVAGGRNNNAALNSTDYFDPATNLFRPGPAMNRARTGHTATKLANGNILIVGGEAEGSAEIYDPSTQSFTLLPANLLTARSLHAAINLPGGKVLIVGGSGTDNGLLQSMEIYNEATGSFSAVAGSLKRGRVRPVLHLLQDGKVQVLGGNNDNSMEIFDSQTGIIGAYAGVLNETASVAEVLTARTRATLFHNGQDPAVVGTYSTLLDRISHTLTEASNQALVAGGLDSNTQALASAATLSSSAASITTDKIDYIPDNVVVINGSGWQPGETVLLVFHEQPTTHEIISTTSIADGNGNFTNSNYTIGDHDIGVTFTLTAKGQSSGFIAQTAFTDAARKSRVFLTGPTPTTVATGGTLTWSATACEFESGGPNPPCIGPVPPTYTIELRRFSGGTCSGASTLASSGAGSSTGNITFAAPAVAGTYSFKAVHPSQTIGGDQWNTANGDECNAVTVVADNSAPVVNVSFPAPDGSNGWFKTSPVTGTVTANDTTTGGSNVTAINCTGATVGSITGLNTPSASAQITVTAQGVTNVSCTATDSAGNSGAGTGSTNTATVKLDSVAPTVALNAGADSCSLPGSAGWCRGTQTAGFTAGDATSGVASPCTASGGSSCNFTQSGATNGSAVLISSGTITDVAGNTNTGTDAGPFKIDSQGPTVTLNSAADVCSIPCNAGWCRGTQTAGFTASDATSGVVAPPCTAAAGGSCNFTQSSSTNGTAINIASGAVTDEAGNSNPGIDAGPFKIDSVAPTVTLDASADSCSVPGNAGWCRGTQTAGFSAEDLTSGVVTPCIGNSCNFTQSTTTNGSAVNIASGAVTDEAGNSNPGIDAGPFKIDSVAPTVSRNTAEDSCSIPGNAGWCRGVQTAGFTASDLTSGLVTPCTGSSCNFTQSTSTNGVAVNIPSGAATDEAGNSNPGIDAGPFKIDSVAPTVALNSGLDSCSLPGNAGWCRGTQTAGFSAGDLTSGVATPCTGTSCNFTQSTLVNGSAVFIASGPVTDVAGNQTASINAGPFMIDSIGPSISIVSPVNGATYILFQAVASSYSCNDVTSGFATCAGPVASGVNIDTASVGAHLFTVNATDVAGNSSSASSTYNVIFNFNGFFQPIDNPGPGPSFVFNRVKAGSGIPAKFSLTGFQGLNIFTAGFPISEQVSCSTASSEDDIEQTVTAGGSSLSYDAAVDQYIYVWKTEKNWAGTCRKLTVRLIDGTDHIAYFDFKK